MHMDLMKRPALVPQVPQCAHLVTFARHLPLVPPASRTGVALMLR